MKYLHLVWSNMCRKKLRTSLTLLSIIVAFVLFGFLAAVQQALVGGVELAGADRLIVREKVSLINLLPISYEERMERIPGVDFATHQTWFGGIYQDPKNWARSQVIWGCSPTKPRSSRRKNASPWRSAPRLPHLRWTPASRTRKEVHSIRASVAVSSPTRADFWVAIEPAVAR